MTLTYFTASSNLVTYAFLWEKVKTVDFSETIAACNLKVGRCRQLIEIMKLCEYWRSRSFLYHIFYRFCMFCALLGQDIRWAFTGPMVLWFNTWFTDFFSQNIKVRGGKKIKITKKIFFIQSETYLDRRKKITKIVCFYSVKMQKWQ